MSVIKTIAANIFDFVGGVAVLKKTNNTPIVIYWHSIAESFDSVIESESVAKENFEKSIDYLVKNYEIISMQEYYNRYKCKSFTNREAVITFDDGYLNNLTVAAPILKKYNLPFTVFISVDNINYKDRFYVLDPRLIIVGAQLSDFRINCINRSFHLRTDEDRISCAYEIERLIKVLPLSMAIEVGNELRDLVGKEKYLALRRRYPNMEPMGWDDVRRLVSDFECTIGSHTLNHCCCHSAQEESTLVNQIANSKDVIEKQLGVSCDFFAYPNGDFTDNSDKIVLERYKMGFSTQHHPVYSNNETIANVGRVSAAREFCKFKILIALQANRMIYNIRHKS